ncbi:alpha-ketoglutarate-dependent dioxygenase AlkB family protein [Mucilaginibacter phyllosphaerae]|uniref:Alkylated DNA repair dioxygenase AlkB n=1 Tax=Mucilaginibacter phyllosphaerae TaxID=1812349 RepID=A0A4Y8A6X8_9SPHI|nr:alpha-ketoglutarate-dependent dioxygenase AlkB [Mucilaginibacter phyllosphaerae]MBB3970907.1 alkylated DNA repair dioxygenase AlkB [Mucilaginibacter phyllosphaerae]TEW64159.1 alpha-ketoglutarate-dependent dioxygenase AlkB [Mucilaginibacter phyllosphaerae]GGH05367.1 alkylated DNA repair protein [Mucilaginibacter phyllosphaerae]
MTTLSLFEASEPQKKPGQNILPKEGEALFYPAFFSKADSDRLYKDLYGNIKWQQDKIVFYGKLMDLPRLTAWYGDTDKPYKYSGIPMAPNPWSPELLEIKNKIEEIAKVNFSSVLLNLYRNGKDSVSWHCDNEKELGINPTIGSVSFGEERTFKLRNLQDKSLVEKIQLSHGSFLLMKGETQHKWEHEIPKTSRDLKPRINLTFRVIK